MPALSRWSGTVVGMTLIAIGLMGIYETYFEGAGAEEQEEAELKLAMAGGAGRGALAGLASQHAWCVVACCRLLW